MSALLRRNIPEWLDPPLWGMVHLPALPGSPLHASSIEEIEQRALEDVNSLVEAGFGGAILENFGDVPFFRRRVPPVTVAAMARIASAVRGQWPSVRLGINCLRNDAQAALAVAASCGADAIRVNVHVGAALTDQGILQGQSASTLRLRRDLGAEHVRIMADLRVKHAAALAARDVLDEAQELRERGLADILLLTGPATGRAADVELASRLRKHLPEAPLFMASGLKEDNAAAWSRTVDGAIVGSSMMHGGRAGGHIDGERARRILQAWQSQSPAAEPEA